MILDYLQMFNPPSLPADLAQATGTYASDNVLDYGIIDGIPSAANGGGARDMGIGDKPALKLFAQITTLFVTADAATLQIHLQGAVDDGTGAPDTFTSWWSTPIYAVATLLAGARLIDMDFPRPPAGVAIPRYMRLLYEVATGTFSAGELVSGVVIDRDDQPYAGTDNSIIGGYPAGLNVAN